jgi:hypothetical protein
LCLIVLSTPVLALDNPPPGQPTVEKVPVAAAGQPEQPGFTGQAQVTSSMVGVTWDGDPRATFAVQVRDASGAWVSAGATSQSDVMPDVGSADARRAASVAPQHGSEPIWTGPVSAVRVTLTAGTAVNVKVAAVVTPSGAPSGSAGALDLGVELAPPGDRFGFGMALLGLAVLLLAVAAGWTPWRRRWRSVALVVGAAFMVVACRPLPPSGIGVPSGAAPPPIISRAAWGAQPFRCAGGPQNAGQLLFGVVHHTVNSNTYSPSDSAQIVGNIQAYHMFTLGYCDIAYNFLVDRYGQVFEGRDGGTTQAVLGAHTGGFNSHSTGVAVIGDFSNGGTLIPEAGWDALVHLLRWKFSLHGINPLGPFTTISNGGGSRYPSGAVVTLPVSLVGHRDLWPTVCPGDGIWNYLNDLRQQVESGLVAAPTTTTTTTTTT